MATALTKDSAATKTLINTPDSDCTACGSTDASFIVALTPTGKRYQLCVDCADGMVAPHLVQTGRTCAECGEERKLRDFLSGGVSVPIRKTASDLVIQRRNLRTVCSKCESDRTRRPRLEKHLRETYDLSVEEFEAMHNDQEGRCAICRRMPTAEGRRLNVDHDHSTGEIRGLLCTPCNQALGCLQDSIPHLASAIRYLLAPPARRVLVERIRVASVKGDLD